MAKKKELLWGIHSVYEALIAKKRVFYRIVSVRGKGNSRTAKIESLAVKRKIPIQYSSVETLDKMANKEKHQGIVMETGALPLGDSRQVIGKLAQKESPVFILVLEGIEDPHNLGAIIRTALCAGVDAIMIPKDRACQASPAVSRSSAGAMEHANICVVTNTAALLREFKKNGGWISGLDADGSVSLFDADLKGHLALVIGGEHRGIRPLVKKECDFLLSIPNLGRINSLNASVAGAIAMYESLRQRV